MNLGDSFPEMFFLGPDLLGPGWVGGQEERRRGIESERRLGVS